VIRLLYRSLIRLHPYEFRDRFGEEMIFIFDKGMQPWGALSLLADAAFSLGRQWITRPVLWKWLAAGIGATCR